MGICSLPTGKSRFLVRVFALWSMTVATPDNFRLCLGWISGWIYHLREPLGNKHMKRIATFIGLGLLAVTIFNTVPAQADCTPPPAGIVGWWKGDGTAVDAVAGNNGTLVNAGYTNGVVGPAFAFDPENYPYGTYTGVQIADSPAYVLTNALTIEGWVRPRGDGYFIFFRGDHRPGTDPYTLAMQGNNILGFFISDENGNGASVTTPLVYGAWVHLAATYDGSTGTMSLYTNGVLAAQTVTGVRPFGLLAAGQSPGVGIGNLNDGGNNFPFHGDIDEIALYDRALTASEIAAIYNAGSAGKCAPSDCTPVPAGLVAWWPGEDNLYDRVGTNNGIASPALSYTNGEVETACAMNSSNAYFHVPASPALNVGQGDGFTIEAWINPSSVNGLQPIVEWNDEIAQAVGIQFWIGQHPWDQGVLCANFLDSAGNNYLQVLSPSGTLVANIWQHVAVTYDRASHVIKLYVNGAVIAQSVWSGDVPQTGYNFWVGRRPEDCGGGCWTDGTYLSGPLDELSLYNRALATNEIAAIYNAGSAGKCTSGAFIIQQPLNQTTVAGSGATLTVGMDGIGPFTYQWRFNGTNISGATNDTLTLANLHSNQSGHYSVVITTPGGTLISSDAIVTVIPQDILVYNYSGKEQVTTFSQDLSYNYSGEMLLIPTGTNGTFVGWAIINGKKQYWISPINHHLWITIARKNGHAYTVLGYAGDGIDTNGYPHLWSSLHRGVNTQLAIAKKRTFSFPNTFTCVDNHIYPDTNTGNIIMVDANSSYQFAPANTQTANNAGQTLTDLVNALTKSLEKQGYQKQ
jgi:hypothetical protein